jgi:hypothetical protein
MKLVDKIEHIETNKLIPYARNAREHSDEQISKVMGSIKEFGFTNPVLIRSDNTIIAGHCRVMASQRLGLEKVPCIRLDYLTETQARALVLADNQLALTSTWNLDNLKLELTELGELDFDLDLTGFDTSVLWQDEDSDDKEGSDDNDASKQKDLKLEIIFYDKDEMMQVYEDLTAKGLLVKANI